MPPTAPSRASSPWSATRSARRSTASSAWPTCCSTPPLTPEQTTYAKAVKTSGDTLLSLIEEILDFSKIEAGQLDLDARPFALAALVEEIVELLAPRAQAKGIEIAAYVDERLAGDGHRRRRAAAPGAAQPRRQRHQVHRARRRRADRRAAASGPTRSRFLVRDTGIGIAPEAQARIFDEFEQADAGSTRKLRRHRPRPRHLRAHRRAHGRRASASTARRAPARPSRSRCSLPRAERGGAGAPAPELTARRSCWSRRRAVEASLVARRLQRWGARTCIVRRRRRWRWRCCRSGPGTRSWSIARSAPRRAAGVSPAAARDAARRIVLLTPAERHELKRLEGRRLHRLSDQAGARAPRSPRGSAISDAFSFVGDELPDAGAQAPARHRRTALSILVAEDNEINALLARSLLAGSATGRRSRPTATEAVEFWLAARTAGEPYDLVLMDVHMPVVDGLEAARRIRAAEAGSPRAAHADHRADRQRLRRRSRRLSRPPAWTASWSSRSTANASPRRSPDAPSRSRRGVTLFPLIPARTAFSFYAGPRFRGECHFAAPLGVRSLVTNP